MANRVLPSREEAQAEWEREGPWAADTMEWAALRGIASGQLVDREAIDTRAAYKVYEVITGRPELTYSGFLRVWDAALPDQEV